MSVQLVNLLGSSSDYNDLLFLAQVTVGFDQLLCLAELCIPNDPQLYDPRKSMKHFEAKKKLECSSAV